MEFKLDKITLPASELLDVLSAARQGGGIEGPSLAKVDEAVAIHRAKCEAMLAVIELTKIEFENTGEYKVQVPQHISRAMHWLMNIREDDMFHVMGKLRSTQKFAIRLYVFHDDAVCIQLGGPCGCASCKEIEAAQSLICNWFDALNLPNLPWEDGDEPTLNVVTVKAMPLPEEEIPDTVLDELAQVVLKIIREKAPDNLKPRVTNILARLRDTGIPAVDQVITFGMMVSNRQMPIEQLLEQAGPILQKAREKSPVTSTKLANELVAVAFSGCPDSWDETLQHTRSILAGARATPIVQANVYLYVLKHIDTLKDRPQHDIHELIAAMMVSGRPANATLN